MKKLKIIGIGAAAVMIVSIALYIVVFSPKRVDLTKYVVAEVQGVSGKGKITNLYIRGVYFPKEFKVKAKISKTTNISNGDELNIDVTYDKEKCKEYGLKVVKSRKVWKVSKLIEPEKDLHYFNASVDMNDDIAKALLQSAYDIISSEIKWLDSDGVAKVNDCNLEGVYVDKETGYGYKALFRFDITDSDSEQLTCYFCFKFNDFKKFIVGQDKVPEEINLQDAIGDEPIGYVGAAGIHYYSTRKGIDEYIDGFFDGGAELVEYNYKLD